MRLPSRFVGEKRRNGETGLTVNQLLKNQQHQDPHHHHQHQQSFGSGSTARVWTRRHQRLWLLFHFTWRWLITVALVASTAGVLVSFENRQILSNDDKHVFNFLVTGLVIAMGVNFTGSLSHFAGKGKWLFLSRVALPPRLFELVMGLSSQTNVLKLFWAAKGRWIMRSLCAAWIFVNVGIQVLAALLGLTYQLTNPLDVGENSVQTQRGNASVVDLSYIGTYAGISEQPKAGTSEYLNTQRASANVYGEQTGNWGDQKLTVANFFDAPSIFENYYDPVTKERWRWLIRFVDYPASETNMIGISSNGNVESDRGIAATARCHQDTILRNVDYGNPSTLSIKDNNGEFSIEVPNNVWNATTYLSDTRSDYGNRTSRVLVLWSGVNETTQEATTELYDCDSRVTYVRHLTTEKLVRDVLQLQDTQARVIAGGIGWSGINSNDTFQSHSYSAGSRWSFNQAIEPRYVGDLFVSRFAIGALNAMNFNGPRIKVDGLLYPDGGTILSVKWVYAGTVLALLAVIHLALLVAADLMLSGVLVRDDGFFATTLFLKPLLHDLPLSGGGMLTSEEVADTVGSDILYTWEEPGEDMRPDDETEYKKGTDNVRYLKAKTVWRANGRRKFDNGVYD